MSQNNKIKTVDLRSQKKIETLEVDAKNCKKILMPYAKKMKLLTINAPIKSFDCSKIPNIEDLKLTASLPKIKLNNNVKLRHLYLDAPVDTLDIGKLTALKYLSLANTNIGVFTCAHPTLSNLLIKNCDITEIDVSNLPGLGSVTVRDTNLKYFIASENNDILDELEFVDCKELMKVEIYKINEMKYVRYDYKGNEDSAIEKNVEEVWNSQTGQIDIMEQQTYLRIYCSLQCNKFPKYDED